MPAHLLLLCLLAALCSLQMSSALPSHVSAGRALDLLRASSKSPTTSTVISPFSFESVLAMLNEGVTGKSKEELLKFLLRGEDESTGLPFYSELTKKLQSSANSSVVATTANRLYTDKEFELEKSDFQENIVAKYGADLKVLDFKDGATAAKDINSYVSDSTHGKIHDLVSKNDVQGVDFVIVNAVYFKGLWKNSFDKNRTKEGDFHGAAAVRKEHFMNFRDMKNVKFNVGGLPDVQVLSLPYQDASYSLYIILPNRGLPLEAFTKSLNATTFNDLITDVHAGKIHVSLPRFKIELTTDGVELLKDVGVENIFKPQGEFGKITKDERMAVSVIKHKAVIEVNEEGTEAAAATAVAAVRMARPHAQRTPEFIADRPFLYAIVKDAHILFVGQYV